MPVSYSLTYQARATVPFWQRCLRRSVRLYLAFDEPEYNELELEAGLQTIESELIWLLLGGEPATVVNLERAQRVLEAAQVALLNDRVEVQALLREPLGYRYRVPLDETYLLSRESATGCCGTRVVRRLAQNYWAAAA